MRQGEDFLVGGEGHFMLADDTAGPAHRKADPAAFALCVRAVIGGLAEGVQVRIPALCRGFSQHQRRAGRGVDLMFMVAFENFDIPLFGAKAGCCLFDEGE